jgi:hypothetical protein
LSDSLQLQIQREAVVVDDSIGSLNENKGSFDDSLKLSALNLSYEEAKMRQHTLKLKVIQINFVANNNVIKFYSGNFS